MLLCKKSNYLFVVLVICCGCGYRVAGIPGEEGPMMVSIPLIAEDEDGVLRNALAQALSETGVYRYSSSDAPQELVVKIEKNFTETIGYEWDVESSTGDAVNRLYPNEGRRTAIALVTLQDREKKRPLLESFQINTNVNYDFVNPVAIRDTVFTDLHDRQRAVLHYSLGQLDSEEGAKGESTHPLFVDLAKKIVAVLVRAPPYKKS